MLTEWGRLPPAPGEFRAEMQQQEGFSHLFPYDARARSVVRSASLHFDWVTPERGPDMPCTFTHSLPVCPPSSCLNQISVPRPTFPRNWYFGASASRLMRAPNKTMFRGAPIGVLPIS